MVSHDAWIADDSVATRRLLEMTLKKTGLSPRTFESGVAALLAFTKEDEIPNLIVLDSEMPDMDGCTTARMLRKAGYEGALVLCSGSKNEALTARATRSGFDMVIQKTAGLSELKDLLKLHSCLVSLSDSSNADEPSQAAKTDR